MPWQKINKKTATDWNEKLKTTEASFYQYPYFISTEYSSFLSKPAFLIYVENESPLAYAAIIEIGMGSFKIGIIEDGPILLSSNFDTVEMMNGLKDFAKQKKYIHLQIRPSKELKNVVENDHLFQEKVVFPFHKKEESCWNIYNKPEDKLLAGFKLQCRRKIVLAGRVNYKFTKIVDKNELTKVYELLRKVAKQKKYAPRPFSVFKNMYNEGKKYGLCDIYAAYYNNEIVNAVFVVKDANCFYHLNSALMLGGFPLNESPPAKLHLFLMKDAFENEDKKYYNISYGGDENLIRFKEYFNPVEEPKISYYTYIISPKKLLFLQGLSPDLIPGLRNILKKIGNIFH